MTESGVEAPTPVKKLEAYAANLLDDFILLREKYALLDPMLFDRAVSEAWGSGKRNRGFVGLQRTLFLSAAQDAAKIAADGDKRTPSIRNIVNRLGDAELRAQLKKNYSEWALPMNHEDPAVAAALLRMQVEETAERERQFDEIYEGLVRDWESLQNSKSLEAVQTIRDKVTAHTELRLHVDAYKRVDLGSLGIKWGDLRDLIEQLQALVERIGILVRAASFTWDLLDEQLTETSRSFWEWPGPATRSSG